MENLLYPVQYIWNLCRKLNEKRSRADRSDAFRDSCNRWYMYNVDGPYLMASSNTLYFCNFERKTCIGRVSYFICFSTFKLFYYKITKSYKANQNLATSQLHKSIFFQFSLKRRMDGLISFVVVEIIGIA